MGSWISLFVSARANAFSTSSASSPLLESLARAIEFEQLQRFGAAAEPRQQMLCVANALLAEIAVGAGDDQFFGALCRAPAFADVRFDDLGEIVDRIQIDVAQLRHFGFDVARHRDVDHEHRAVAAAADRGFDGAFTEHRERTAGGRNDDVVLREHARYVGELDRARTEVRCQRTRVGERAVRDRHRTDAGIAQVLRDQFDRVAGAEQQRRVLRQVGEDLLRERHRGVRDRHRIAADVGIGAHLLRDVQRHLRQQVQFRTERAGFARGVARVLHLAEDLRLAEHLRIETRRDAHQVPGGVAIPMRVRGFANVGRRDVAIARQPVDAALPGRSDPQSSTTRCGCTSTEWRLRRRPERSARDRDAPARGCRPETRYAPADRWVQCES